MEMNYCCDCVLLQHLDKKCYSSSSSAFNSVFYGWSLLMLLFKHRSQTKLQKLIVLLSSGYQLVNGSQRKIKAGVTSWLQGYCPAGETGENKGEYREW